ncbi:uncharacterized protein ATNIH1004_010141 [Aspergillus tanneri]|uniref:Uncharacterized protein n=1 Tax=Aspergillus tanneri TaxID=1220188 RepID=A0A5M9M8J0_9EURO|nr:uncharacterized protein ATNIH1004_010141 [Aspergillus tanneri]KAA8643372.1 hypothetical protein ATNIH1004_010141 [Aspergillus tanneri]
MSLPWDVVFSFALTAIVWGIEGYDEYTQAGAAPDWLYFNCSFSSSRSRSNNRYSTEPDAEGVSCELYLEALEIDIEHVRNQGQIGQNITLGSFSNAPGLDGALNSLHYTMDVDEGVPPASTLASIGTANLPAVESVIR